MTEAKTTTTTEAEAEMRNRRREMKHRSSFLGANFVFDARGLARVTDDVVAWCDGCGVAADRLGTCASVECHKILVVCRSCERKDAKVRCCAACAAQDSESETRGEEATGRRRRRRRVRLRRVRLARAEASSARRVSERGSGGTGSAAVAS